MSRRTRQNVCCADRQGGDCMFKTLVITTSLAAGLLMLDVAQPTLTGSYAQAAQRRAAPRPAPRARVARPAPRPHITRAPRVHVAKPQRAPRVTHAKPAH